MKKFVTKYSPYIIIVLMFLLLIPGIALRIRNEKKNNNVTISLLYNDVVNKVSKEKLSEILDELKDSGIDTVSVMEDDLNALTTRGDLTCIKFGVLRHKYDKESMEIADMIEANCPDVTHDSYIILAAREAEKQRLEYVLPRKFNSSEYKASGVYGDINTYVLYDGRKALWDYALGYDEETIKSLTEKGFNVALVYKVKNYSKTEYLYDIDRIVKENNIEYLNIKSDSYKYPENKVNKQNYKGISDIINQNNMTLVVTENTDQLSNQKCIGYAHIFNETMKDGGSKKVLRSFETYDDSQEDDSKYKYRTAQYFNSTVDRNIRFITVTQVDPEKSSYTKNADYTVLAVKEYKQKIEDLGFTVNGDVMKTDYTANKRLNSAACAVIMVMFALLIVEILLGKKNFFLTALAIVVSALAFLGSFVIPESLVSLYPTAYCAIQSCFAITVVVYFINTKKEKLNTLPLTLLSVVLMILVLLISSIGMGAMLSGLGYYINNDIFRGIKLSLMVPVFYTALMFYFVCIKKSETGILQDIKNVFLAQIKVYWVLIASVILAAGVYYIIRSGNVNEISSIEQKMRNLITEIFPARPRTKEFLIGYPAIVLLAYYMKKTDINILKWLLAVAASILAASVTNSFCHVFTDYTVIVERTMNGLLLGVFVSVVAYILNLVLVKIMNTLSKKLN